MGKRLTIALVVLALLPLAYPSAYFALVKRDKFSVDPYGAIPTEETYRAGGGTARAIFRPLNRLDRILRPEYWGEK